MSANPKKLFHAAVAALAFCLLVDCEKRETQTPLDGASVVGATKETDLVAKKRQLQAAIEEMKVREAELRHDISQLEKIRIEVKENVDEANAQKELIVQEVVALKKQWEKECEGFSEAPSRPLPEIFREMAQKVSCLLKENNELQRTTAKEKQ
jgi:predicted  nucleic acid-binding Zn-ribbon protein